MLARVRSRRVPMPGKKQLSLRMAWIPPQTASDRAHIRGRAGPYSPDAAFGRNPIGIPDSRFRIPEGEGSGNPESRIRNSESPEVRRAQGAYGGRRERGLGTLTKQPPDFPSFPCSAWECRPGRSASHGRGRRPRRRASKKAFPRRAWERVRAGPIPGSCFVSVPSAAKQSGFPIRDSGFPKGKDPGIANPEFGIPRGAQGKDPGIGNRESGIRNPQRRRAQGAYGGRL